MLRAVVRVCTAVVLIIMLMILLLPVVEAQAAEGVSIVIPAIGVEAPVVSIPVRLFDDGTFTWDVGGLRRRVGHFAGTAWFGEAGKIILGGHAETTRRKPEVFYYLDSLRSGDDIIIRLNEQTLHYQVIEKQVIAWNDLSVLQPAASEVLVLMTCDRTSFQNGVYTRRVIVTAVRVN